MKANELRIGNLVLDQHKEEHIISANCFQIFRYPTMDNDYGFYPIPITEEWLLRFGFELSYKSEWVVRYSLKSNHKFTYKYNIPEGKSWLEYHGGAIDCIHVHHMQNIIYALTQTELEIETLQV